MNNENRRNFHRIFFDAPVTVSHDDQSHHCQLEDLSLNGALLRKSPDWKARQGDEVQLTISLENQAVIIKMDATVMHIEQNKVGLQKTHIDMDSISHLRRLVELNLGDSDMLHRDLEHLVEATDPD